MEKMKMHSMSKIDENVKKIAALFPECITEIINDKGKLEKVVDIDAFKQLFSKSAVEGNQERYQFTWPDKRKAKSLVNQEATSTLRPCREESVNFDTTENLYIEGDNLEVLKLLQETYLGKIKMIYIDPPYNTGNDFVYEDDFSQKAEEYTKNSGQYDNQGNQLVANTESNGRFHTDWLNMIYPRLKLARDLLKEDGAIFISIDDNEQNNLIKIGNEIFGADCFVATFPWRKRTAKSDVPFGISQDFEWIVCYARSSLFLAGIEGKERKYYESDDFPGRPWRIHDLTTQRTATERPNSYFTIINPRNGDEFPANPNSTWRVTKDSIKTYFDQHRIIFPGDYPFLNISKPVLRYWKEDDVAKAGERFGMVAVSTKFPDEIGMSQDGTKEVSSIFNGKVFSYPKPISLLKFLIDISTDEKSLILDFFSGSATTAHAVMKLNAEDNGSRKFIMVQLPENCSEESDAGKAGYKNICEIGKERIRRAGKQILEEVKNKNGNLFAEDSSLDVGFRDFKLDSSNMNDVYYTPDETDQRMLDGFISNIKEDRTAADLLFQVMLDLGVLLSAKIIEEDIGGKKVFNVDDNYLIACFDENVDDNVIMEAAKKKPTYFVMRDSSLANDSVSVNFDQIFARYSPDTVRKVL